MTSYSAGINSDSIHANVRHAKYMGPNAVGSQKCGFEDNALLILGHCRVQIIRCMRWGMYIFLGPRELKTNCMAIQANFCVISQTLAKLASPEQSYDVSCKSAGVCFACIRRLTNNGHGMVRALLACYAF